MLISNSVEYRETCTKVFGAQADITMSASMALVAISRKSANAEHQQEAVKICEELVVETEKQKAAAGAEGKAVDTKKSAFQLSLLASAKRHLASLYTIQTTQAASSAAAGGAAKDAVRDVESTKKAETLWKEQLEVNKAQHGVAHKATLASLASLVGVWARSDKAEVRKQAQEKLDTSVVEVLTESCVAGTSSVDSTKLHECGVSLAKTYLSCGFSVQAWALLKQLRFHVVARGKIAGSDTIEKASTLKLTDNVDRRSMVFIASFEETLRASEAESAKMNAGKVVKVTFSDIMTDLLTEGILYDRYSLTIASKSLSVEQKLFDGARLYVFLKINKEQHQEQLLAVEESLFKLFVDKFGGAIKTEAIVTRAFLIAIIEELGQQSLHEDNLVFITCTAVTARVHSLLLVGSYAQAVDIATAWYQFMVSQNGFKNAQTIAFAFKLSLYLAGLGVNSIKADAAMQSRMLELSKTILRETLTACKTMNIDLVQLQASELNSLVRLMGQQKNYEDLEWLLTQLWNSRIIQSNWSATTVIALGRRLVEVLFIRSKRDAAISLAESIAYNLRRTWGLLDAATVDMNNLLSALCVADKRYAEALDVHEEILRALLDLNMSGNDDNGAEDGASELMDFDEENAAALALQQLELVRRVYSRNAGWPESEDLDMAQLTSDVVAEFAPMAPDAYAPFGDGDSGKWSKTAPSANDVMGTFVAPQVWEFSLSEESKPGQPALSKRPSHMLRSLQLSRQRSYGDLSEARKRLDGSDSKSFAGDNSRLAAPVH